MAVEFSVGKYGCLFLCRPGLSLWVPGQPGNGAQKWINSNRRYCTKLQPYLVITHLQGYFWLDCVTKSKDLETMVIVIKEFMC